ncbi:fasciclin-like arabinogalactan protein 12 [Humulus lupulus]|uniref:fasciclin-like arabinogalactan protein 12 n=1 Tax=Humulus lupulus TaxID=3486 RepID=UPI002B408826|nr:fasciclin-like arabinogalactan protein 12 [Humulus lupulus]
MNRKMLFNSSLLLILSFFLSKALAQSAAPALSPGPPPSTDIYKILTKAGQFTVLIRLLKSTQVGNQINNQLGSSNSELTVFAPTDNAFSSLKTGTLNGLSDQQKVQLLQFHLVPSFISITNFQTMSNPVQTQASDTYEYPLNITTSGNQVNITTGIVNTTISGTVYSDNQLAVYQVDKVLQPLGIFAPRPLPPAPAPAPPKPKKKATDTESSGPTTSDDSSDAIGVTGNLGMVVLSMSMFAAGIFNL